MLKYLIKWKVLFFSLNNLIWKKKKKKRKEKKAQEVIFSRTISKLFYSQICFNDVYICKNLSEWEIYFLLSCSVINAEICARNRYHWKTVSKLPQHSLITTFWLWWCCLCKKNELDVESHKLRGWFRKLCLFYKIRKSNNMEQSSIQNSVNRGCFNT